MERASDMGVSGPVTPRLFSVNRFTLGGLPPEGSYPAPSTRVPGSGSPPLSAEQRGPDQLGPEQPPAHPVQGGLGSEPAVTRSVQGEDEVLGVGTGVICQSDVDEPDRLVVAAATGPRDSRRGDSQACAEARPHTLGHGPHHGLRER